MLSWPNKDPEEVLDYTLNWSKRVGVDPITASSWEVDLPGLEMDSNEFGSNETVVWLSGGVLDETYVLTNHVTTQAGREMEQSVKLKIREK